MHEVSTSSPCFWVNACSRNAIGFQISGSSSLLIGQYKWIPLPELTHNGSGSSESTMNLSIAAIASSCVLYALSSFSLPASMSSQNAFNFCVIACVRLPCSLKVAGVKYWLTPSTTASPISARSSTESKNTCSILSPAIPAKQYTPSVGVINRKNSTGVIVHLYL